MLIAGVAAGLILGLLAGGHLSRLLEARFRWPILLFGAVVLRYGTELALRGGLGFAETLRLPFYGVAFLVLLVTLWANRNLPGLLIAAGGVTANAAAIVANGGWMPVWGRSLAVVGLTTSDLVPTFHRLLPATLDTNFLLHLGFLGDILPIPLPLITNVASLGDLFIAIGLGWFVFATLVRGDLRGLPEASGGPEGSRTGAVLGVTLPRPLAAALSRTGVGPETGLAPAPPVRTLALDRPVFLGGTSVGSMVPSMELGDVGPGAGAEIGPANPPAVPTVLARLGEHPYVRLALDARFSAFWIGQTISLFGDRLNQVALAVLVLGVTGSPLATALVFLTATAPNLLLGPIAGTFVDRWDQRAVMVISDLLRAALVLLLPLAAAQNVWLAFPIVFLVTAISIFFRPAKAAVVPRLVRLHDLMAANSATWTGETIADIAGYPLAGLFVSFLGSELALAFWADAASYLISAVLIFGMVIPPVVRTVRPAAQGALRGFLAELGDGFRFLRSQPALYQNTLVSAIAQMALGALLALTVVYARDALDGSQIPYPSNYTAIEAAIGIGNLVGGLAVGAAGVRLRKGWLIGAGVLVMGLTLAILGSTTHVYVAVAMATVLGIANLVFVIPTQTLFAELTPMPLMGRVVALRSSLVFGSMTLAMAMAGLLAEVWSVGLVISAFGLLTAAMGVLALSLPAIRNS